MEKTATVTQPTVTASPAVVAAPTKSSKIKELYDAGVPIGDIAKQMGIRYAFAYQVSQRYAASKGTPFKTGRTAGPTIASKIRELSEQGMTVGDIAKQLNKNYTFCWMTVDAMKKKAAKEVQVAAATK